MLRTSRRLARTFAVLAAALLSVQCIQDFAGPGKLDVSVQAITPEIDTVEVGDSVSPPEAQLVVASKPAQSGWDISVIEGSDVLKLDSVNGYRYLAVFKRGTAKVRLRPFNSVTTDTTKFFDFTLVGTVPRVAITGPDTIYSLGDTLQLSANAMSIGGVAIPEAPTPTWSVVGLDTAGVLLADGRVRGVKNGQITIRAQIDTATQTRVVYVRQKVRFVTVAQQGVFLTGGTTTLTATASDAKSNAIANPTLSWRSLNPNVATVNATTGVVTAVTSGPATIAASSDGNDGYALVTVALPNQTAPNLWAPLVSGTTNHLNTVWGFSATSIFTTGREAQSPILQSSNGNTWTPMQLGQLLHGLWGTSATSMYAVGLGGKILRYNGTAWQAMTSNTNQALFAVWGASDVDVFAVGAGGTIMRYDGTAWAPMTSNVSTDLLAIWGRSRADIYAVGVNGVILHYNGTSWNQETSGTTQELRGVWGSSASSIHAVGVNGTIRKFDGVNWVPVSAPGGFTGSLNGVWGTSATDVYVAAQTGVLRLDGGVGSVVTIGGSEHFNSAWGAGTSTNDVILVGNGGSIYRGVHGATVTLAPASPPLLEAIGATVQLTPTARDAASNTIANVGYTWSTTDNAVATVNTSGLVSAVNNGTASICAVAPGGAQACRNVSVNTAASVTQVIVTVPAANGGVGTLSAVAKDVNNNTVSGVTPTWSSLNPAIATIDASSGVVTAVASGQVTMVAQVGTAKGYGLVTATVPVPTPVNIWAQMNSGTTQQLNAIWGTSASNVYAAGQAGTVLRYDGTNWSPITSGTNAFLIGLWGTSATNVFVAGDGTIRRYDGTNWTPLSFSGGVRTLWGLSPENAFTVGGNGSFVRSNGTTATAVGTGTTTNLEGIWGTAGTNMWAVGQGGAALRYNGSTWTPFASGTTQNLNSVWGTDSTNVYAAGVGTIQRFDGTSWSTMSPFDGFQLMSIWGSSPGDVYFAGTDGGPMTIRRWNGTALSTSFTGDPIPGGTDYLLGIWGHESSVFAVGYRGTILRGYRGGSVTVEPLTLTLNSIGATQQLTATAKDASNTTIPGTIRYTWSTSDANVATVSATGLISAAGNGTANICAIAQGGAQACRGVTVSQVVQTISITPEIASTNGANVAFSAVARDANGNTISGATFSWTSLNGNVATVNASGTASMVSNGQAVVSATKDGVTGYGLLNVETTAIAAPNLWLAQSTLNTNQLYAVWGASPTSIFVAGDNGTVQRYNGTSWTNISPSNSGPIRDLWGLADTIVFAAGRDTIYRYNGSTWTRILSMPTFGGEFNGIWASAPNNVYVVSSLGIVRRYNGTTWSTETGLPSTVWRGIWGSSAKHIVVVGDGPSVYAFGGTTWAAQTTGLTQNQVTAVWGSYAAKVFAVTAAQTAHFTGAWSLITTPNFGFTNLGGTSFDDLYGVSFSGNSPRLIRYNGSTWSSEIVVGSNGLLDVAAAPGGAVFAVGQNGGVVRGYRGVTVPVTPASPALTVLDDTITASAVAKDAGNNTIAGVAFTWSTTDGNVATVNASGLVTAKGNGSANICATVAVGGAQGCTTVTVTGFSPEEIEAKLQEASWHWFNANTELRTALVTSAMARTYTASWNNANINFYSSIDNSSSSAELWNRNSRGWQNTPIATERSNVSALWNGGPTGLSEFQMPVSGYYGVLRRAVDVLKIIRIKGVTVRNASDTKRAETFAVLMQGAALSGIALNYDKGFAPNENTAPYDSTTFAPLSYVNRADLRDSALAKLNEAVTLANANSFTTLASWTNGNAYSSTAIARIARTLAALTHANYARDATEAATVNWASVATLTSLGVTADFIYVGDGSTDVASEVLAWGNDIGTIRVSTRVARLLHPATQTDPWPAPGGNAQPSSVDARLADGSFGDATTASAYGTVVRTPGGGSQFAWSSFANMIPARGDYHQSNIAHVRYDASGTQSPTGIVGAIGPMPILTVRLNSLLQAEAHLRTGNSASALALINASRAANALPPASPASTGSPSDGPCTSIGKLSKNLATDCTTWAYLIYEKELELLGLGMQPYFEQRRLPVVTVTGMFVQGLIPGTPREMPVPWFVLQGRGEALYSWGGTNAANSTPP